MRIYVLDGGGPKDSENTLNSFLTKCGKRCFDKLVLSYGMQLFYIARGIFKFGIDITGKVLKLS